MIAQTPGDIALPPLLDALRGLIVQACQQVLRPELERDARDLTADAETNKKVVVQDQKQLA